MRELAPSFRLHPDYDEGFASPPNLVVVDGGKGQLNAALEILDTMEITELPVTETLEFFESLPLRTPGRPGLDPDIAGPILKEVRERLRFLVDVGLEYLTLARASGTLSGGESQRIRLATQIGSGLTGVLYVLDEPSIGLHQRDNRRLIDTLVRLGGEEFGLALPGCSGTEAVDVFARLRAKTRSLRTISAGIAEWDRDEDWRALVARADAALYRAKREGRDRVTACGRRRRDGVARAGAHAHLAQQARSAADSDVRPALAPAPPR